MEQSITLKIAGKDYPLKATSPEMEQLMRLAAETINQKLAEEGVSVTFISSEIEEMLRTCSRLIVMRDRNIVGELTGADLTQERVMSTIVGRGDNHE